MSLSRRDLLTLGSSLGLSLTLGACASPGSPGRRTPIVFVHGNGDSAALWQTTAWRFESNGWPRDRLFAIDMPYPLARDTDAVAQPGRSGSTENREYLRDEVNRVLALTGSDQVVLIGNSRGGNAIRNYILNGGGAPRVSHAILCGTPNHGVWAIPGYHEGNEFSGTGPFLRQLNAPKNPAGDEVTGPVRWLTIRSDHNDKYAQADGLWIGRPGQPTFVDAEGPALRGALNRVIPGIDHRETAYSPAAFAVMWLFLTGQAPTQSDIVAEAHPVLQGKITGLGVDPLDPRSGDFSNNLPLPGARLDLFAIDDQGRRLGEARHSRTVGPDGLWGPFVADAGQRYEWVIRAPGYATTHLYRSPLPRSSEWLHLRAERLPAKERGAGSVVVLTRPRGYIDPSRDQVSLDGSTWLPGIPATGTAGFSTARLLLDAAPPRAVRATFNGESVQGLTWPAEQDHLTVLEISA